jgi:hypothetical protein
MRFGGAALKLSAGGLRKSKDEIGNAEAWSMRESKDQIDRGGSMKLWAEF